ncbi:PQQ-binding-like beta-propeller repeat protein [Natronorubrum sp. FCH18a]|uniref:PQQ-binding-like beta-propeller repeat protein n=1 Tax=Natronorubrum sp. FCH18a TaxID=3447018 RepID=UPI003F50E580
MSSAEDSGPQPTAHDVVPGCSLDRRTFIKGTAAAIAAGGAASSGTAAAIDNPSTYGIVAGVKSAVSSAASSGNYKYGVLAFGGAGLVALASYEALRDDVATDPTSDPAILHQMATSEAQSLAHHEVNFSNRLNDARPVANLAARHGISSAWENGANASTGFDAALQRIRQHYETPEFNHIHTTNKSALQLGYIAGAAEPLLEDGEHYENFEGYVTAAAEDPNTSDNFQLQLTGERTVETFELHDGTMISDVNEDEHDDVLGEYSEAELVTPIVDVYNVTNDEIVGSFPMISEQIVNSWDETKELVHPDVDGLTDLQWDYRFQIPSYTPDGVDEEDHLATANVFDGREFCKLLHRIWADSDTVTGNYSQSFVEDLYAELNAGNVTSDQIRSPEGMVHFLAGTSDPSNERFRIAMLQQLGMEQPDFSIVSGMDVTWSGATETVVSTDPDLDDRHSHPDGFVENESYNGVVFGENLPEGGYQPGSRYAVGMPFYYVTHDESVVACDMNGNKLFEIDEAEDLYDITISPDQSTVCVPEPFSTDAPVRAYDVTDGSVKWSYTDAQAYCVDYSPDGNRVYVGDYEYGIHVLDAETGTHLWDATIDGRPRGAVGDSDGNVYVCDGGDGTVTAFDKDGNELWTKAHDVGADEIVLSPDEETLYTADGPLFALDPADGTEKFNLSYGTDRVHWFDLSDDGKTLYIGLEAEIRSVTADANGDENWTTAVETEGQIEHVCSVPGDDYVIVSEYYGNILCLETEQGSVEWEMNVGENTRAIETVQFAEPIDGLGGRSLIFDDGQTDLWNGVLEVDAMYDAGGENVEHVNENTISDLENLTGDDISTIIETVDGYDSEDDIQYTRDVLNILEAYDLEDDADQVETEEPPWDPPEYDTEGAGDFANYMEQVESMQEQLETDEESEDDTEDEDDGIGIGLPGFDFGLDSGGELIGLGIIAVVVLAVVGFVTDLIPGLGNN